MQGGEAVSTEAESADSPLAGRSTRGKSERPKKKNPCGHCKEECATGTSVPCGFCEVSFHGKCIDGLSDAFLETCDRNNKMYGGSMFLCMCCRKLTGKVNKTFKEYDVKMAKYEERLKILDLENKILQEKVGRLEGKTEQATEGIVRVEKGIETEIEKAKEQLGSELKEREERSENVVLYGIEESSENDKEKAKEEDEVKVHQMAMAMGVEVKGVIVRKFRAGKKDETKGKGRPMIVKIEDEETRAKIIANARRLSKDANWKNVYVSQDMTFKQREEARKEEARLKAEAEAKNESETDTGKPGKWIVVGPRGRRRIVFSELRGAVGGSE